MFKNPFFRGSIALLVVICFGLQPVALAETQAVEKGNSKLAGKIVRADGRTVVSGAMVRAYHLSSEQVFTTATGSKGEYEFTGMPYGYFDVAVETSEGLFVADQVINLPPAGKAVLSMTISTASGSQADLARDFPGAEQEPVGVASVQQKLTGREFWRSPKGVGLIAGLGGAALLAIASGGGSSGSSSPSTP